MGDEFDMFDRLPGPDQIWTERVSPLDIPSAFAHEGVAALGDLRGALSRAQVREELGSRFTILPELSGKAKAGTEGAARALERGTAGKADERAIMKALNGKSRSERAQILAAYQARTGHTLESVVGRDLDGRPPLRHGLVDQSNMLSRAQFDDVVKLMSDIELQRTRLHLDDNTPRDLAQRDALRGDLEDILQTESGRALVGGLAHRKDGRVTTIETRDNIPGGGHAMGENFSKAGRVGVEYTPGKTLHGIGHPPLRSDVVLYHEMVHAEDFQNDKLDSRPVSKGHPLDVAGKTGRCEYHAVGLGDQYLSRFSEGRYSEERQRIGQGDRGERLRGLPDDDLELRTSYAFENPMAHYED